MHICPTMANAKPMRLEIYLKSATYLFFQQLNL